MAYSQVTLSLTTDLFAWLDEFVAEQRQSRSSFIRELLETQRARDQEDFEQLVAEWKPFYDEINDEAVAVSEAWLAISTVPHLEWNPEEEDKLSP